MKNLKSILAAVAVAATVIAIAPQAHANPTYPSTGGPNHPGSSSGLGNRTLQFLPNTAFSTASNGDGETSYTTTAINTVVHVRPYLYVTGVLGGHWDIDGWGEGQKTVSGQYLDVYHSDKVNIGMSGWTNPTHTLDTGRQIPMTVSLTAIDGANGSLGSVSDQPVDPTLNNTTAFSPDGQNGLKTLGHMRTNFVFKLSPDTSTYSGTYEINPTLTVAPQ